MGVTPGCSVSVASAKRLMLHCNMNASTSRQLGLEELVADMRHARRQNDLGRLALLAYCEVRRWAREASEPDIAERSSLMMTGRPHASRAAFLEDVDALIAQLELVQVNVYRPKAGRLVQGTPYKARVPLT